MTCATALSWGDRGPGFESRRSDHKNKGLGFGIGVASQSGPRFTAHRDGERPCACGVIVNYPVIAEMTVRYVYGL